MKVTKKDLFDALKTIKIVLTKPVYALIAVAVSAILMIIAIWLPNLGLIWDTIFSSQYSLSSKWSILIGSLGAISSNFTATSRITTILVVLLVGLNIALFVYYAKKRVSLDKASGTSLAGMIIGFLGVGCASCGSVILTSIFGLGATSGFLGILPFRGLEFGIIGIVLLIIANYSIAKKISKPSICKIKPQAHEE